MARTELIHDRLKLDGHLVPFERTPNQGGRIRPTLIVVHDTAGRLNKGSSVNWLTQRKARASAHFVIERDGTVTQLAQCDRSTWHAGRSRWNNRSQCNGFSIGIEIVNPGKLTAGGTAWFGKSYKDGDVIDGRAVELQAAKTSAHGSGTWMHYTPEQIETVTKICKALAKEYQTIKEIVAHWEISPGRKIDTSPLFPLDSLRRAVFDGEPIKKKDAWPLKDGAEDVDENGPVRAAQAALKSLDYDVQWVDGIFGPNTEAAVLAWEKQNGLILNGEIDENEFKVLVDGPSKGMPVGPATESARASAGKASTQMAGTAGVLLAAAGDQVAAEVSGYSLWGAISGGLAKLVTAMGQLTALKISVDPKLMIVAVCVVIAGALWTWRKKFQGVQK